MYIQDFIERGIADFIGNGTFDLPGSYSQVICYGDIARAISRDIPRAIIARGYWFNMWFIIVDQVGSSY